MKRLLSIVLAAALMIALPVLPVNASGTYQTSIKKTANGSAVEDLTTLSNGTEVEVTVTLTRADISEGEVWNCRGLQMNINVLGMDYIEGSAVGFKRTTDGEEESCTVGAYTIGGATGTGSIPFFFYFSSTSDKADKTTVPRTVSVSARYKVTDHTKAQAWAPTPIIYTAEGEEKDITNMCTLTFDANGGTASENTKECAVGSTIELPTATRSGYIFLGWSDGTESFNGSYKVAGGKTLIAQWGKEKLTVTFMANGGYGYMAGQSFNYKEEQALKANSFKRTDYVFAAWNTKADGSGTQYTDEQKISLTDDLTLYARWSLHGNHNYETTQKTLISGGRSHVLNGDYIEHTDRYETTRICTDCEHEEITTAAETTSVAHGAWHKNSTQHWYVCSVDGCGAAVALANHTFVNGVCSVCGYTIPAEGGAGGGAAGGGGTAGGGGAAGGGGTVVDTTHIADEEVPLTDADTLIVTALARPTAPENQGITTSGSRNPDGSVTVKATDASGNSVKKVVGGVKVSFSTKAGEVAILLDESGNEMDLLEKSVVEGSTAYVLVDGSCRIDIKFNALPFDDVSAGDWYNSAVNFVSSHELFNGVKPGIFAPDTPMSRAMLVMVLWRLENKPEDFAENIFPDVPDYEWYVEPVEWATKNGIVTGYNNGTFQPDKAITREEMAAILHRYMNWLGYDTTGRDDLSGYTDAESVSPWALENVQWAVSDGIISGVTASTVVPQGTTTRAQVATMFMRIVTEMVK